LLPVRVPERVTGPMTVMLRVVLTLRVTSVAVARLAPP